MRSRDRPSRNSRQAQAQSSGAFEQQLNTQAAGRQAAILRIYGAPLRLPELPPGWRAQDVLGTALDGFVPIASVDEPTLDQARRGLLETRDIGGIVYIRPALVSILRVRGVST